MDDGLRVLREMEVRLGSNGGQTWKSHELRFFFAMKGVCQKGNSNRVCVGKFVVFTGSRRHA